MSRRARALVLVSLGAAVAACGLFAAPGEYASGGPGEGADGSQPPPSNDGGGDAPASDGQAPPASKGTIVVVAGTRDPLSADDDPAWTSDVLSGLLDEHGHVARWRVEASAPVVGPFDAATLLDGRWITLSYGFGFGGGRGQAIQSVGWAPGPSGDWRASRASVPGGLDEIARTFVGHDVVTVGGTRTVTVDGGTSTFFVKEVHVAPVDTAKNVIGDYADGPSLGAARSRPGLIVAGGSLYVVGGRAPVTGGITSSVEAAKVDEAAGTIAAFADQPALADGAGEHKVFAPSLAASDGWLYCAGGRVNGTNAPSDVVLAAKIDGGTGALSPWKALTKLPKPARDFAFVAHAGRLYVVGGFLGPGRSDEVWSAPIAGDGTIGAWDTTSSAKLPAARADLVARAY